MSRTDEDLVADTLEASHRPERRQRILGKESVHPDRAARTRLDKALDGHQQALAIDRDLLGFTQEIDSTSRRLVNGSDRAKSKYAVWKGGSYTARRTY